MRETPLFVALTRPPMVWGIPVDYFAVWLGVSGLGFLFFDWKLACFISLPVYGVMWLVAQYEPKFVSLVITVFRRTRLAKNTAQNKGKLYRV